jgi:HD-GYP domain-containing protein (c-di-GMP phosphodiesterase class II)
VSGPADPVAAAAPPVAAELAHRLYVLLKAASVYGRDNEGYRRHSDEFAEILARAQAESGGLRLEAREGRLFLNRLPIRFASEASAAARYLCEELSRRGVGVVDIGADVGRAALDDFAFAFQATRPRRGEGLEDLRARLREARADGILLEGDAPAAEGASPEEEDPAALARKAFFRAMAVVEDAMKRLREDQPADLTRARRAVHGLVDRVIADEQALFELGALRSFDAYTYAHCVNVSVYSVAIGTRLGLDRARLAELGFGGLFHDLGKARLPVSLIDKPDAFDEEDWRRMRLHPALGAKALLGLKRDPDPVLARAVTMAFEHHLGVDGSGYPRLRVPRRQDLFSRICAVADAFDAMTSGRVYQKRPMGPDEALRRMALSSGSAFDAFLLRALIGAVGVFPIGTVLLLDTGELGVVWRNDPDDLMRPTLKLFADAGGAREAELVSLAERDPETGRPRRSVAWMVDPARHGLDPEALLTARGA